MPDVKVPPNSEFIAQGIILDSDPKWEEALVEPSIEFMGKHEVLVARLLVKPTSGKIPLKFVNVSDREIELHKNSLMGAMEEVSIFRDDSLGIADNRLVDTPNKLPEHLAPLYIESSRERR